MARTAHRNIVTDAVLIGAEAQHVDAFSAQKRHAGLVGFRGDPGACEVLAQLCADLSQDVDHSAGGDGGGVCSPGGGTAGVSGAGGGSGD